jgi:hypothetical protein
MVHGSSMAALQPSVSALASRSGTDLAKPSWPRGNIYADTQEAMEEGGAPPQPRARADEQGSATAALA